MGRQVIWSPRSLADLKSIHDFISKDSFKYATHTTGKIVTIVEGIPAFPMLGRSVPEFGLPNIRERIFASYRIVYRITNTAIEVLTVHHSSRLLTEV